MIFEGGGGSGRFEKNISCKAFTVIKNHATRIAIEKCMHSSKNLPVPLASEEKILALHSPSKVIWSTP